MPARTTPRTSAPPRVLLRDPRPSVDGGQYDVKRCVGDRVEVSVEAIADGHEVLKALVKWRAPGKKRWHEAALTHVDAHIDGDTWVGAFDVDAIGAWTWTVEAWIDRLAGWRREIKRKDDAGQEDVEGELAEGALLFAEAAERASGADAKRLRKASEAIADASLPRAERIAAALDPETAEAADRAPDRSRAAELEEPVGIWVDRLRARFGSWYELFPRSWGGLPGVTAVVPQLADLGFDVLYLPPVHPIGVKNRKGRNNALVAGPEDPGSPWAIGNEGEGGHEALHPELGTFDDFATLVDRCAEHDIDVALDLAFQCSASHPWLTEHPEWFQRRPDGSLKFAENPPKKYQDIYNFDFTSDAWKSLWDALLEVTLGWVARGVSIFRVDNPHTKPLRFWEWLIAEVHRKHPEVVFLAEAFTKRATMRELGRIGFSQSYTYFTWKTSRYDLTEYLVELSQETADYFRPNFFANTPDILHESLQAGGIPAFRSRLVLASTLSPSYGIYSGYENGENVAVRPGSEEYLDSEKYEAKERTLDGPLLPLVKTLNEARRAHPALQQLTDLRFLGTANEEILAYAKRSGWDTVICIVNLNPHWAQEGLIDVVAELGLPPAFTVRDELTGGQWWWHLGGNYVRLEPGDAHVLGVVG